MKEYKRDKLTQIFWLFCSQNSLAVCDITCPSFDSAIEVRSTLHVFIKIIHNVYLYIHIYTQIHTHIYTYIHIYYTFGTCKVKRYKGTLECILTKPNDTKFDLTLPYLNKLP